MSEHASDQSVVGIYKTMDEAERAVRALDMAGFPVKQITIVTRDISSEKTVHGYVTACDVSKHILKYEEIVKAGKILLIGHGSAAEVKKAQAILAATGAAELTSHGQAA